MKHLIASALLLAFGFFTYEPATAQERQPRPKIGLVLKGGGALGFAHVGVLKVLERNRVPIDFIAGTSMGSIVGAAYASGSTLEEMEKVLSGTDWDALFGEKVRREGIDYRLKSGRGREIFGETKFSFEGGKFLMPHGIVEGQVIRPLFQRLFGNPASPIEFDSLPVPFRAVTADVETGEAYVPSKGDLATVVRASMSIPGAFSPVEIDGRVLVDGGIVNNLPVDVVLNMGADVLIVVDLKSDLAKRDALTSPLSLSGQMVSLLLMQNSALSLKLVRPQDVVIQPDVNGFAVSDFAKGGELAAIGEDTAETMTSALARLSVSEAEYRRYSDARTTRLKVPSHVHFVRINNASNVSEARIKELTTVKAGDKFDGKQIDDDTQRLYQTGYFKSVQYSCVEEGDASGVEIQTDGKDWLGQFIRLGFSLEDNLNGDDSFRLGAAFRTDDVGSKDSYLEVQLEIGKMPRFSVELYRPLVEDSPYFFAPKVSLGRSTLEVSDGNDTIAEYTRTEGLATLVLGRRLSTLGELGVGYSRGFGELSRRIGDPALPDKSYDLGDAFTYLEVDTLDKPDFPTEGLRISAKFNAAVEELGAPSDFQEITGVTLFPFSFGRNTLILRNAFSTTFDERPIERTYSLGGFLSISGISQNSLPASNYDTGSVIFLRRFSELQNPLFSFDFFSGGSLELTTINNSNPSLPDYDLITSGALFVGADTPLLPVYLGVGMSSLDEQSVYIAFGRLGSGGR